MMPAPCARWFALPASERRLLLAMMAVLPVIGVSLRTMGMRRTARLLERVFGNGSPRAAEYGDLQSAQRLAELAAVAGRRGPVTATCLRQALLVRSLLERRGLAPQLKLGVLKRDDDLDAHAWVELEGQALGQATPCHRPLTGVRKFV